MTSATYFARRDELEHYFDRTAVEAWKRLTSDAPVSRIRATVRAGRDEMRAHASRLAAARPSGRAHSRRRLRHRRARVRDSPSAAREVVGVDLSPTLVEPRTRASAGDRTGRARRLSASATCSIRRSANSITWSQWTASSTMRARTSRASSSALAARTRSRDCLHRCPSHARRSPSCMASAAFSPRRSRAGDRADLRPRSSAASTASSRARELAPRRESSRIDRGFYISQAMEVAATMSRAIRRHRSRVHAARAAGACRLPMRRRPNCRLLRLLRLSLFQVTVGMAAVLLIGTLNRVMIVELAVPSWIVACMLALPLLFAPLRALIGFRSDNHRSVLGWRRVPFIWFGTMAQFGGFAIMPFALLILSGDTTGPLWAGQVAAALAFLLVGAGLHTVQTVGLGAGHRSRPRAREAARCRPFVRHVARGHGHQCGRLRLAAETFQRGSTDTGRAGRRGRNDGSQLRRALEARAAHFDQGRVGAGACDLPRRVERLCDDGPHPPAAHRDRARHRRFQHAGHSA